MRGLHQRAATVPVQVPRVLGIDDWAWRRGHRYGTILCDLEKRRVVDLLPDREAETVARWLRQHPGTEIVSRDHGGIYAEATRRAAPHAVQVADRWHLLRNLSEALRHALAPHHRLFTQAARLEDSSNGPSPPTPVPPWSERERQNQQVNRQRRYERWQQVRELLKTGASDRELGRQLDLDHRTIKKFRHAEVYPEAAPRVRQSIVDEYAAYLDRRLREGCRSSTRLWRELRNQGFSGQVNSVRYWLRQRLASLGLPALTCHDRLFESRHGRSSGLCLSRHPRRRTCWNRYIGPRPTSRRSRTWPKTSSASSVSGSCRL